MTEEQLIGAVDPAALDPVRSGFDTAVQLLGAGRASLLLRETVEPVLTVAASTGINPILAASIKVRIGDGIAGLVAERGEPLLGFVDGESFLCVPLLTDRGVEGVLNLTDRAGGEMYSVRDLAMATRAVSHIGRLIEYSRHAARDPVSGLHNRRSFEEMLEREVARSQRLDTGFAVIFLDLNDLKFINDRYGHDRGDEAIQGIGRIIQHSLRPYDFASRYGGDEFVLLLSSMDECDPDVVLARVTPRFEEGTALLSEELQLPISTSIGVACWPGDSIVGTEVVAIADERMYVDKRQRKARARQRRA